MRNLWKRLIGAANSGLGPLSASLDRTADEIREATKHRPETDYWRGYTDAMDDMKDREQAHGE